MQDAIVAAAADEFRSSSGSADGSQEAVAIDDSGDGNAATVKGSTKSAAAPHVAGNARHGKDATRKSTREAVKSDKAGRGRDVKNDAKGKGAKETGADAAAEAPTSARPKLPRPEGVAPCPRCHSEETKFCYYNNYNIKQPRYFCRGCQRYWTAGGMLRNVPVGAGRRKNKNGSTAAAATEDEDGGAATLAGRILAGVGTGARGQLSGLARAAAGMKSERRDGSSDGSVTEADGDDARIPAGSAVPGFGWFGTPSQFSRATSGMGAGSSGEGVADGVAANAPADFGSMLGSMMANPFLAVQAAQAMHAGGWTGVNHDAMSAAAAQMAMYAQAQAAAAAGGGADASGNASAAATRGGYNPLLGGGTVPGTQNGAAPHKPTASAFTALPAHLQMQLSGGLSMSQSGDASPRAAAAPTTALASSASADASASVAPQTQAPAAAEGTATAANTGAAVPGAPTAAAVPGSGFFPPAAGVGGASAPNWAAMLSMMGPAVAAMQQHAAAVAAANHHHQQQQQQHPVVAAAAAAAAAGLNPQQMQQITAALASGAFGGTSPPAQAPTAAEKSSVAAHAPGSRSRAGSAGSDDAAPSTAGGRDYREAGVNGSKRFKVSEDRAGHAG